VNPIKNLFKEKRVKLKKTKARAKAKKNNIIDDSIHEVCQYIVTKKNAGIVYGRSCGNICNSSVEGRCKEHKTSENVNFDKFAFYICQHSIMKKKEKGSTVKQKGQKGHVCRDFIFGTESTRYCKEHLKRHPNNKNTCNRTFKARVYPTESPKN
jgi:hypothetical protein